MFTLLSALEGPVHRVSQSSLEHLHSVKLETDEEEFLRLVYPSIAPIHQSPSPPMRGITPLPQLFEEVVGLPLPESMLPDANNLGGLGNFLNSDLDDPLDDAGILRDQSSTDLGYRRPTMQSIEHNQPEQESERDEGEEDKEPIYMTVIREAQEHFGDRKPDFCVRYTGKDVKEVKLASSEKTSKLVFRRWGDKEYGYWELKDGEAFVVRYMNGHYHAWLGVCKRFSQKPMASLLRRAGGNRRSDNVADSEEDETPPGMGLRQRTMRQKRPFEMDKTQHNLAKKGISATDSDIEMALTGTPVNARAASKRTSKPRTKQRMSDSSAGTSCSHKSRSASLASFAPPTPELASDDLVFDHTTVRTRFNELNVAMIPIYLTSELSLEDLLCSVEQKWEFQLQGRRLTYGVVKFPWLNEDSNILLHPSNPDGYQKMLEEVRYAPVWNDGRCHVDLEVFAE